VNQPSISVVISTLNRPASLADTIEGLLRQSYSPFEVIVVNGPSDDRTDLVLARYRDRIRVASCTVRNLSASRNIGIAAAQGDLIAFIDDDAVAYVHWLRDLAAGFDEAEVAAVGGFVFDHTGYDYQYRYSFCNRLARTRYAVDPPRTDHCFPNAFEFPYLQGTNIAIRSDLLEAIGGFDEEFAYSLDETDVCMRLIDAGYVVKQIETAFVYHRFLPSDIRDEQGVTQQWYPFAKNRVYFALKNLVEIPELPGILKSCLDEIASSEQHLDWLDRQGQGQPGLLGRFRSDSARGLCDGIERALFHPRSLRDFSRTLSLAPSGEPRLFAPCRTLTPRGPRLNICLRDGEGPHDSVGPASMLNHLLARGLSQLGHTVHVLAAWEGDRNRVDFEDGVWLHRLVGDQQVIAAEIRRIDAMDPVDIVHGPASGLSTSAQVADAGGSSKSPETLAYYRSVVSGLRAQLRADPVKELLSTMEFGADFQARQEQFSGIRGWLHPEEGYTLLTLAEHGPGTGAIVEIGSYAGLSTSYLALGAKRAKREPVTAIDHFQGSPAMQKGAESETAEIVEEGSSYRAFSDNMERLGLKDHVVPVVSSAQEAAQTWSDPIRLLFIDGDHSYEASRQDFQAFDRSVAPGGVVCFHDIGVKDGVTRFFRELVATRSDYEDVSTVRSLAVLVKR
jgi:GT2 family glycosyltransferase/predicted O-methyltransferase YrrM